MTHTGAEFDPTAPLLGQVLGDYRLVEAVGAGGMGAVYRGVHVRLKTHVAVKVMADAVRDDRVLRARFLREARIAASVPRSPRIVQIHDVSPDEAPVPYIVMELVEGESLAKRVTAIATRAMDPNAEIRLATAREIREIMRQALEGLAVVHARGIVHRDVKPENLIFREGGEGVIDLVILDFGIGRRSGTPSTGQPGTGVTDFGTIVGTPGYMSPEQVRGGEELDGRSDLYALGVVLYEMMTGRTPFADVALCDSGGRTQSARIAVMHHTVASEPPRPANIPHPGFEPVALRLVARDPAARFQSAEEVIAALDAIDLDAPPAPARQHRPDARTGVEPSVQVPTRTRRWAGAAAFVAIVLAAVGFGVWRTRHPKVHERTMPQSVALDTPPPTVEPLPSVPLEKIITPPAADHASVPAPVPRPVRHPAPVVVRTCISKLAATARAAPIPSELAVECAAFCAGASDHERFRVLLLFANHRSRTPRSCVTQRAAPP